MSRPTTKSSRRRKRREAELRIVNVIDIDNGNCVYAGNILCASCGHEDCEDRAYYVETCSEYVRYRVVYPGRSRGGSRTAPTGAAA